MKQTTTTPPDLNLAPNLTSFQEKVDRLMMDRFSYQVPRCGGDEEDVLNLGRSRPPTGKGV